MDAIQILDVGHPRGLRLDFNALALFEGLTGRNLLSKDGWKALTAADILILVWVAASQLDRDVSIYTIGSELTPNVLPDLMAILAEWGAGPGAETQREAAVENPEPPVEVETEMSMEEARAETARVLNAFGAQPRE